MSSASRHGDITTLLSALHLPATNDVVPPEVRNTFVPNDALTARYRNRIIFLHNH
ncbi:hypothetical protein AZE42_14127 [Rhizopogon vesiculosus]|uniref:Uncharacterized protein n=1 Tax=Rhizopogon vesiculosus TaxID=180088 RepID=A0A1J8QNN9_9AGAM|nr:hypothetical protein AZE42_14127 [Rhizopogon vesiculosus]